MPILWAAVSVLAFVRFSLVGVAMHLGAAASSGSFYDEVMRELVIALGAALFLGNLFALSRRRTDIRARGPVGGARSTKSRGSSRVAATGRARSGELVKAPIARSLLYVILGFVMMVAGIASLVAK